jgi:hypothetical protein
VFSYTDANAIDGRPPDGAALLSCAAAAYAAELQVLVKDHHGEPVADAVVLGCNIHDWMVGYIYVSETPFFAKTEASGKATVDDLPAGEYSVRIWHPSMEHGEDITARRYEKAWMPVCALPRMRAWISWVPS